MPTDWTLASRSEFVLGAKPLKVGCQAKAKATKSKGYFTSFRGEELDAAQIAFGCRRSFDARECGLRRGCEAGLRSDRRQMGEGLQCECTARCRCAIHERGAVYRPPGR